MIPMSETVTTMAKSGSTTVQGGAVVRTKYKRGAQPQCTNTYQFKGEKFACNHSESFHGGEAHGACKALGCHCPKWKQKK
jgi:ribosomal protein S4E